MELSLESVRMKLSGFEEEGARGDNIYVWQGSKIVLGTGSALFAGDRIDADSKRFVENPICNFEGRLEAMVFEKMVLAGANVFLNDRCKFSHDTRSDAWKRWHTVFVLECAKFITFAMNMNYNQYDAQKK